MGLHLAQTGVVLRGIFSRDFALTRIKKIRHFFGIYVIIFGLTGFGRDDSWRHVSCVGDVTHRIDYVGDIITRLM
jgi:hypothetical protein